MISHEKLQSLAIEYGTPLFVVDEAAIEDRVNSFSNAFKHAWSNTLIFYSVKTNYQPWIVKKMHDLGVIPEVISGFELDLVKSLDLTFDKPLIVNGPAKTEFELRQCLDNNYLINVDNLDELKLLIGLAEQENVLVNIGLRVRPRDEGWKRFGFAYNSSEWDQALCFINHSQNVNLIGLHTHIGTGIIDLRRYSESSNFMLQVAESIPCKLKYFDMGGGFATQSARLSHYSEDEWRVPSDLDYAHAIVDNLYPYISKHDCQLFIEPGRALVDEAICLLSRIISVDNDRVILDSGKNIVPSVQSRIHPVELLTNSSLPSKCYDLFGPLCMGSDCLGRNVPMSNPNVSDLLAVMSVGAYCQSQSMQFIKYQPPMVVVASDGGHRLVRRRQTIIDLLAADL